MIKPDGSLKMLQFNCRIGGSETMPIMLRLKSNLVNVLIDGRLDKTEADWDRRVELVVVLAAHNYPETPRKGDVILGLPRPPDDAQVFHSGTALRDGQVVTAGGRVLYVSALGDTVKSAQKRAYEIADDIRFDGIQFRRDIGHRAIRRSPATLCSCAPSPTA